ncbi:hypothetical protein [Massilia sp. METH4]|uniref:hypothetical protein n=1 Tax=Massilia sp. METH4 TaxID=3123041 RepID=UPI0030D26390
MYQNTECHNLLDESARQRGHFGLNFFRPTAIQLPLNWSQNNENNPTTARGLSPNFYNRTGTVPEFLQHFRLARYGAATIPIFYNTSNLQHIS